MSRNFADLLFAMRKLTFRTIPARTLLLPTPAQLSLVQTKLAIVRARTVGIRITTSYARSLRSWYGYPWSKTLGWGRRIGRRSTIRRASRSYSGAIGAWSTLRRVPSVVSRIKSILCLLSIHFLVILLLRGRRGLSIPTRKALVLSINRKARTVRSTRLSLLVMRRLGNVGLEMMLLVMGIWIMNGRGAHRNRAELGGSASTKADSQAWNTIRHTVGRSVMMNTGRARTIMSGETTTITVSGGGGSSSASISQTG